MMKFSSFRILLKEKKFWEEEQRRAFTRCLSCTCSDNPHKFFQFKDQYEHAKRKHAKIVDELQNFRGLD